MDREPAQAPEPRPPLTGPSLPAPVLLVLLPILVIGFFFSIVAHALPVAFLLALLAVATVVRLALSSRGRAR